MATSMLTDPHRRHRRLLGANHSRIDQVQITHHCCLPLDMIGLIGMAQVPATLAYGIKGLRRGDVGMALLS